MRLSSLLVTVATAILVRGADNTTVASNTTVADGVTTISGNVTIVSGNITAVSGNVTTTIGNTTVSLNSTEIQVLANLTANLTAEAYYGADIAPWYNESTPGWYYGDYPEYVPSNLTVPWLKDGRVCWYLDLTHSGYWCPDPESTPTTDDGYTVAFSNYTGAIEGSDYLTYGLVDTVQDCKEMCNSVDRCVYINSYHDVNGKGGSPLLTCSLFSKCHTTADATNKGGQTQPDGSIDYITDSEGYCKST